MEMDDEGTVFEPTDWQSAQKFELDWHDKMCTNTFYEEEKQFIYASKMGIEKYATPETPHNFKNHGEILDIGGGETSMLLKVEKPENCFVVDPLAYPPWVVARYQYRSIKFIQEKAEDFKLGGFDEIWIYNTLQHTENPELICKNALQLGKIVRVFEWVDTGVGAGHIHNLTEENLNKWLGGQGKVEVLKDGICAGGKAYFGVFLGHIK